MERPILSNNQVQTHAGDATQVYLVKAIELVDTYLETDPPDPVLLAALIDSQTKEYISAALVDAIYELAEAVQQLRREGVEVA